MTFFSSQYRDFQKQDSQNSRNESLNSEKSDKNISAKRDKKTSIIDEVNFCY